MPTYVLTTSEEQMTLGGRIYASRQNDEPAYGANLLGVKYSTLKSWENDRAANKLVALAGLLE